MAVNTFMPVTKHHKKLQFFKCNYSFSEHLERYGNRLSLPAYIHILIVIQLPKKKDKAHTKKKVKDAFDW